MDTDYIFKHRDEFREKPSNYEEIVQICEMITTRRDGFRRKKHMAKRRDRVQAVWQEDDPLAKSLNFIFNKISQSNLELIYRETVRLLGLMREYPEHLSYVVYDIFSRGLKSGYLIDVYAKLFKQLVDVYPELHSILVIVCEYVFYSNFHSRLGVACDFVSSLYTEGLLTRETLIYCLDLLVSQQKYYEFSSLLEKHVVEFYEMYRMKLDVLFMDHSVPNKVKFKITDIYDLLEESK